MSPLNQKFSCMAGYSEPAPLNNNNIILDSPKEEFNKMDQTVSNLKFIVLNCFQTIELSGFSVKFFE